MPLSKQVLSGPYSDFNLPFSCKGFFKRTLQNKDIYQCVSGTKTCNIYGNNQRNRCQFCRFRKCLLMGMAVRGKYLSLKLPLERLPFSICIGILEIVTQQHLHVNKHFHLSPLSTCVSEVGHFFLT